MAEQSVPARQPTPFIPAARTFAVAAGIRRNWQIILVLLGYALTPLLEPLLGPVSIGDDWVYVRSVEMLLREGRLHILDLSVVTLLFQVAWGALFGSLFGLSFGVLRLSTFVMVFFGGMATYGVCRELQVARGPSALATAAYLFNPLSFVLAYTFMSDPHFTALLMISTWGYVRGLRTDLPTLHHGALIAGSLAAACAFLVRQQGALIPLAVLVALLVQRRLTRDRAGVLQALRVVALPALAMAGYYLWLALVHGVPEQQRSFFRSVANAGWEQSLLLVGRMTFIAAMYLGLFTLPVALAALSVLPALIRVPTPPVWFAVFLWAVLLLCGLVHFQQGDPQQALMPRMPYISQYLGPYGLGPADILGGRRWLVSWQALDVLTALCVISSLLFVLLLARQLVPPYVADFSRASAGVVLAITLGQGVGILPPSFHFRDWIISVDRYLLPLLPLSLCLGFWALRGLRPSFGASWVVVTLAALVSIAGTRDVLELQTATWNVARDAVQRGVPLTALDAGAAWDGYALYDYGLAHGLTQQTPGGPWWTSLFAPATTSEYVVSTTPLDRYEEAGHTEVTSWLSPDPTVLYLLQRAPPAS